MESKWCDMDVAWYYHTGALDGSSVLPCTFSHMLSISVGCNTAQDQSARGRSGGLRFLALHIFDMSVVSHLEAE